MGHDIIKKLMHTHATRSVLPDLFRLGAPYRREIYFTAPSGDSIAIYFKV